MYAQNGLSDWCTQVPELWLAENFTVYPIAKLRLCMQIAVRCFPLTRSLYLICLMILVLVLIPEWIKINFLNLHHDSKKQLKSKIGDILIYLALFEKRYASIKETITLMIFKIV